MGKQQNCWEVHFSVQSIPTDPLKELRDENKPELLRELIRESDGNSQMLQVASLYFQSDYGA